MIYLAEPKKHFTNLMQVLEKFNEYAGYKLNVTKTQILMLNCKPNTQLKQNYDINWDAKCIKYLGINITKDLTKLYRANYDLITNNIKSDIERWSTYPMSFSDRIKGIKMNVLPRMLYLFQSLPVEIPKAIL